MSISAVGEIPREVSNDGRKSPGSFGQRKELTRKFRSARKLTWNFQEFTVKFLYERGEHTGKFVSVEKLTDLINVSRCVPIFNFLQAKFPGIAFSPKSFPVSKIPEHSIIFMPVQPTALNY